MEAEAAAPLPLMGGFFKAWTQASDSGVHRSFGTPNETASSALPASDEPDYLPRFLLRRKGRMESRLADARVMPLKIHSRALLLCASTRAG